MVADSKLTKFMFSNLLPINVADADLKDLKNEFSVISSIKTQKVTKGILFEFEKKLPESFK